jgi:hypothetical protein
MDVADAERRLRAAGFEPQVEPGRIASSYQAGTVARTDPWGGSTTSAGSVVSIYVSNGVPPVTSTPRSDTGGGSTGRRPPFVPPGVPGNRGGGGGGGRGGG